MAAVNASGKYTHFSGVDATLVKIGGTQVTATAAELNAVDGATAGTAVASKSLVVDSSKDIAGINVLGVAQIDADSGTGTTSSSAVTVSKMAGVITTEALTTAAGANEAITLTNTLIAAGDMVFVQYAGGTNTNEEFVIKATAGSGSATITLYNTHVSAALDGTVIFNFLVIKA